MIKQAATLKTDSNSCIGLSHKRMHVTVKERLDALVHPQRMAIKEAAVIFLSLLNLSS